MEAGVGMEARCARAGPAVARRIAVVARSGLRMMNRAEEIRDVTDRKRRSEDVRCEFGPSATLSSGTVEGTAAKGNRTSECRTSDVGPSVTAEERRRWREWGAATESRAQVLHRVRVSQKGRGPTHQGARPRPLVHDGSGRSSALG